MKSLMIISLLGLMSTTQVNASYEVIGETKDCSIHTAVIQKITKDEDSLLIISETDIFTLSLIDKIGSVKIYKTNVMEDQSFPPMTFEAQIMGKEMSVLSKLKIYLSGVLLDCLIDK